ncbi:MAG: RluA family pseudouridine synthase [Desulfuromonadales bacterium]|nr:RluA family pseudouridine synthase [Desulfuromonadales bacterium]
MEKTLINGNLNGNAGLFLPCFSYKLHIGASTAMLIFMPLLTVKKNEEGLLLEHFLQLRVPAAPPTYLRQLIKAGKVKRAGTSLAITTAVHSDDAIQLPDSARLKIFLNPKVADSVLPEILYESREILIINKPSGLAIHSGQGHESDNLTDRVKEHYARQKTDFQIAPIQRLDLATSGPVLFGKGRKSCAELGQLFMAGAVKKNYLALVKGKTAEQGTLATAIPAKGKMKQAVSGYRRLAGNCSASLLEIRLYTGRRHQIRRQLADLGHPLFGDQRYHGPQPRRLERLFLHCRRLAFVDPFNAEAIEICCPLPDDLVKLLEEFDIHCSDI